MVTEFDTDDANANDGKPPAAADFEAAVGDDEPVAEHNSAAAEQDDDVAMMGDDAVAVPVADVNENNTNGDSHEAAAPPPPAKRARITAEVDDAEDAPATFDVQRAVLKYKRKKGTIYDVTFTEEEAPASQGGNTAFGIQLAAIKVKNANSLLPHVFEMAIGERYRGRPPTASDQSIIVQSILDGACATAQMNVQRNDFLFLMDDKLVNITDKKRLKYYRARLNNGARPMKLTFFRPSEEDEEDPDEEDEIELHPTEAVYATKYEPPSGDTPSKKEAIMGNKTIDERSSRRALLERRLQELEILQVETSMELTQLRTADGISDLDNAEGEHDELPSIKGDEDFAIPPHIMYYPPMKLRRKKLPALNEACVRVENLLRQRMVIDKEADKVRAVVEQAQDRLQFKEKELERTDGKIAPALEEMKYIEMDILDTWKVMYLKLKGE